MNLVKVNKNDITQINVLMNQIHKLHLENTSNKFKNTVDIIDDNFIDDCIINDKMYVLKKI